jgi:hypothetical protein
VGTAYAVRDLGREESALDARALPFGANMAFRTLTLRGTPFDPALGRTGAQMLCSEETAVMQALLAAGHSGRWIPAARVRHYIPPERQNLAYLRRYYAGHGATVALGASRTATPRLLGRPRWLWREALEAELRYRLRRLTASPPVWIEDLKRASMAWGQLRAVDSL